MRTEQIKRTAKELIKRYPDKFSVDFENNKHSVHGLVKGGTPKVLNQIAGYITRFVASEKRQLREQAPGEMEKEGEESTEEASADA